MADTSIFSRLRRLFSTDVVIRNEGGSQLKVVDTDHIQTSGEFQTNSLVDRFGKIYTNPAATSLLGQQFNLQYQYLRTYLYSDYDTMDTDAIIASALDIIADECTLKNDMGEVLQIRSSDDDIQKILYNLFYDVLNIEFNLWSWIRQMCKYGDFFLKLEIAEKYGVYNVIPYTAYHIQRRENFDMANPAKVQFVYSPDGYYTGGSGYYATPNTKPDANTITFDNYEMAHFRLLTDVNYLPYGRSYLEPARKVFKQLILMEDAMLIHRIMRAPEKRIFYMNVGGIPPQEIDQFMERTVARMKKTPYVDQSTGDYNLKFNIQNMTEDFYIPVRGNDASTKIETTKGLDYDGTTDIEYLKNRMLAALKIPKAFLGYDENLEGKSTLAAMDIRFARTIERLQRTIVSELNKIALVHLYTQGFTDSDLVDFELSLTGPSIVFEQEKVELYKSKVELSNSILDKKILSTDFIYKNVFNLSEDEIDHERNRALDDAAHIFRTNQIENEGNDPIESGESYGTPHDLANVYANNRIKDRGDVPSGYDEREPGRPKTKLSDFGSDKGNFSRDPLGKSGLTADDEPKRTNNVSTFALEENSRILKKLSLGRLKGKQLLSEEGKTSMLSEENIIKE